MKWLLGQVWRVLGPDLRFLWFDRRAGIAILLSPGVLGALWFSYTTMDEDESENGTGPKVRKTLPNPNVMFEYGYAMHALSDKRVISVINEAYGSAEGLPFNLKHLRWPIRYSLPSDASGKVPEPGGLQLRSVRRGRKNPQRDPRALVELLWLDSALDLLVQRGAVRGVRGKPRWVVWERICQHFDVDEIATRVREHIKARAKP